MKDEERMKEEERRETKDEERSKTEREGLHTSSFSSFYLLPSSFFLSDCKTLLVKLGSDPQFGA
jgi:hypothetical protein